MVDGFCGVGCAMIIRVGFSIVHSEGDATQNGVEIPTIARLAPYDAVPWLSHQLIDDGETIGPQFPGVSFILGAFVGDVLLKRLGEILVR